MKRLVIFDLDGTLLDSLEDLADSANHILSLHGFPTHPVDAYRYFVGDGVRTLFERIMPTEARDDGETEQCIAEFVAWYDLHKEDKTTAYPGMNSLLKSLKDRGLKIAVATNKVHASVAPLMAKYYPDIRFDAVVGQREGVPVKPAPQIVHDILALTGCTAAETMHVGDTATDMRLAHNAGVTGVGVLWGYRPLEELLQAGADRIISRPDELTGLIDTENSTKEG